MANLKYLSVCSGIEAATVAWEPLGWKAVGFSEIEKFPSSVLQHHYPDTPNFGDMCDHKSWPESDVDVLVGGTPCQSFSVAGLRQGMADPRGNLALVYLAIAEQYRTTWLVWENVPGVLSSDDGRDFGSIIGAMVKLRYSIAYRVLNAQYFGVPQRRRRVFVVGYLGDWRYPAKVLFNPESLRRNSSTREKTRQDIAPTIMAGVENGGPGHGARSGHSKDELIVPVAAPLGGLTGGHRQDLDAGAYIPEVANPLTARMHKGINTTCDEGQTPIPVGMAVRKLTPMECERLQGFPDGYTDVPGASDSGRYRALGNSMAVPVMNWIGKRIQEVHDEQCD